MIKQPEQDDLPERMRQFEVVCKVAIQTNVASMGGVGTGQNRINISELGQLHFGLPHYTAHKCFNRARLMLSDCSNSVSSETLLIQAKKRLQSQRLRALPTAA